MRHVAGQTSICMTDIVFVLDESSSVGSTNFEQMKAFAWALVRKFQINSGRTRVGAVTFSGGVGDTFPLNAHSTTAAVQDAISSLRYASRGNNTAAVLNYVRTNMLAPGAGDRGYAPNAVIVLTDGFFYSHIATSVSTHISQSINQ